MFYLRCIIHTPFTETRLLTMSTHCLILTSLIWLQTHKHRFVLLQWHPSIWNFIHIQMSSLIHTLLFPPPLGSMLHFVKPLRGYWQTRDVKPEGRMFPSNLLTKGMRWIITHSLLIAVIQMVFTFTRWILHLIDGWFLLALPWFAPSSSE